MATLIAAQGGPAFDRIEVCPHHPRALIEAYRQVCDCRKPATGMLRRSALALGVELTRSFLVGDRITDIVAGARAGCRTVMVETGRHADAPIETAEPLDPSICADHLCCDLAMAADWILANA
jgi:D-glycero-D-manno-heptose 1,7-bisphosphate phosphatase